MELYGDNIYPHLIKIQTREDSSQLWKIIGTFFNHFKTSLFCKTIMLLINISNAVQWVILRFCSSCFVFYTSLIPCMKLELPYLVAFSFSTVTSVYIGDIMSFSLLCGWLNVKSPRTNSLFVCFRNNTLTFWDDKTRLASKKFKSFSSFNTSVLKQVEQVSLGNPLLCPQYARAHYAYPPLPSPPLPHTFLQHFLHKFHSIRYFVMH